MAKERTTEAMEDTTFGISVLPGRPGARASEHVVLSWGSAVGGSKNSEIYATVIGRQ